MCKRSRRRDDPLVDLFLSRYKLNLLPLPLKTAACGQVYVQRPHARLGAVPGSIAELVTPKVVLPAVDPDEPLPDVAGERSSEVSLKLGLKLLGNFLLALGAAPAILDDLHAGYERSRATAVRFAFREATRDSMDPFSIGTALIDHTWIEQHPWVGVGNSYFVSAGVVRSKSISIETDAGSSAALDLGLDALSVAGADAGLSCKRHESGAVTYKGREPLAIAVELYDLRYNTELGKFEMGLEDVSGALRRGAEVELEPAFPAEDDEALLEVEELLEDASLAS
jgi:hypothetical protein